MVANNQDATQSMLTAIETNNVQKFESAIANGANVHYSDENGFTPLMLASKIGTSFFVGRLIECGVDVHAVDKNGKDALFYLISKDNFLSRIFPVNKE